MDSSKVDSSWKTCWRIRPGTTYLNHGSFGPPPETVKTARQHWQNRLDEQPMDFFVREQENAWRASRDCLGEFVGCSPGNLVFVDNATYAMNVVANSFTLSPGDQVLVTDHEYGAVLRIWQRACALANAELVTARLPQPFRAAADVVAAIRSHVTPRTRLVVVSHITSATAVTLPVTDIAEDLAKVDVPLCVDGPHAVAQLDLQIDDIGCAFYAASCHKWLSAPFGSGFLYVHPRWQARVRPPILSWGRLLPDTPENWADEFIWSGTRDISPFLTIPVAVDFLRKVGVESFRNRTHELARYARSRIQELFDAEPLVPDSPEWFGTMAHLPLPAGDCPSLQKRLWTDFGIEVPIVNWDGRRWIRVSCHLYNDEADIDKLASALRMII